MILWTCFESRARSDKIRSAKQTGQPDSVHILLTYQSTADILCSLRPCIPQALVKPVGHVRTWISRWFHTRHMLDGSKCFIIRCSMLQTSYEMYLVSVCSYNSKWTEIHYKNTPVRQTLGHVFQGAAPCSYNRRKIGKHDITKHHFYMKHSRLFFVDNRRQTWLWKSFTCGVTHRSVLASAWARWS